MGFSGGFGVGVGVVERKDALGLANDGEYRVHSRILSSGVHVGMCRFQELFFGFGIRYVLRVACYGL